MRKSGGRGFTLAELMLVVGVLSMLAAIALPKFTQAIRRANESASKGKLGSIRSALEIYYADNEGRFPAGPSGTNTTYLQASLVGKYMKAWPDAHAARWHGVSQTVDTIPTADAYAADPSDDGEWVYVGNASSRDWGVVLLECYHTDSQGVLWSTY